MKTMADVDLGAYAPASGEAGEGRRVTRASCVSDDVWMAAAMVAGRLDILPHKTMPPDVSAMRMTLLRIAPTPVASPDPALAMDAMWMSVMLFRIDGGTGMQISAGS